MLYLFFRIMSRARGFSRKPQSMSFQPPDAEILYEDESLVPSVHVIISASDRQTTQKLDFLVKVFMKIYMQDGTVM